MESNDNNRDSLVPDLLFHTILTVIDYHKDPSGATRSVFVLGTHSALNAAKSFALRSLEKLNFTPDDFEEYAVRPSNPPVDSWGHGDGILVFALAPAGQVFLVGIDTTPNNELLAATSSGEVILPEGLESLHYVLQTTIDYNMDRTGSVQSTGIQGSYVHRASAFEAAYKCLDAEQFVEYDTLENDEMADQWPFDELVVRAVSDTGQNHYVTVRTVPWADRQQRGSLERATESEA